MSSTIQIMTYTKVLTLLAACLLCGCSNHPPAITAPNVDAAEAGEQAVNLYDQNGDSVLSKDELQACPAMLNNLDVFDRDSNGEVTAKEVAKRIDEVLGFEVGLAPVDIEVNLNGRPLVGVSVHLNPEPFWGDALKPAVGVTDQAGNALPTIDRSHLPEAQQRFRGVIPGTYQIWIEDSRNKIPKRYTKPGALGKEIARDTVPGRFTIDLKSNRN